MAMLFLLFVGTGCCGSSEPSTSGMQQVLAALPPHSPGQQVYDLLKREGFSPRYKTPRVITGNRDCYIVFPFGDFYHVHVNLDESGHVVSSYVNRDQNYP
jgi:hypothetical protein